MRGFLQQILIGLSGFFLALGLITLLSTIEQSAGLITGEYGNGGYIAASVAAVALGALVWRRLARTHRVLRGIATTTAAVAIILLLGLFALDMGIGYANTKKSAYVAMMKGDLRNLVSAEEAFYSDSARYTTSLAAMRFTTSPGVTQPVITLTRDGWTASVDHANVRRTCVVFVGTTLIAPATHEGEPACTEERFDPRDYIWSLGILATAFVLGWLAVLLKRKPD